jgi:hypothetical protein
MLEEQKDPSRWMGNSSSLSTAAFWWPAEWQVLPPPQPQHCPAPVPVAACARKCQGFPMSEVGGQLPGQGHSQPLPAALPETPQPLPAWLSA